MVACSSLKLKSTSTERLALARSEKMTLHIVQVSDTHISNDFPQRLLDLEKCIQAINELEKQPEVVIHTGDISHDGLGEEYHSARKALDKLNAPYFVMAGNRDKRETLLNEFSDDRYRLPPGGWVQYAVDTFSVRLIMLDTVSDQSNKGKLCDERIEHLEAMLAADSTKPIALFLHHPPYEAVGIPDPYQYEQWSDVDKLKNVLARFPNICGMYCGHVHRPIDGSIAGIRASAITCSAGDLRKGDVTEEQRTQPVFKSITLPE